MGKEYGVYQHRVDRAKADAVVEETKVKVANLRAEGRITEIQTESLVREETRRAKLDELTFDAEARGRILQTLANNLTNIDSIAKVGHGELDIDELVNTEIKAYEESIKD